MARADSENSDKQAKEGVRTSRIDKVKLQRSKLQAEIEDILKKAAAPSVTQLTLNLKKSVTREDIANLPPPGDIQNPKRAYELYYLTLGALRRRYFRQNRHRVLPEKAIRALNKEIREFLKKGEKNADSRMAETKRMSEAIDIFKDWMDNYSEADVVPLYQSFCDANNTLRTSKKA